MAFMNDENKLSKLVNGQVTVVVCSSAEKL